MAAPRVRSSARDARAAKQARSDLFAGEHSDSDVIRTLAQLETRVAERVLLKRPERDPNARYDRSLTFGARLADTVVSTMGSWRFIIVQSTVLVVWITANVVEFVWRPWDPYPFILLNLALSFQAAYAAPIIMMSQNRQAAKDRLSAELDLHINLRAEALLEELHGSVDELRVRQWNTLIALQQRQIELLAQLLSLTPVDADAAAHRGALANRGNTASADRRRRGATR
jgi:uncharacterized membrane protein